MGKVLVGVPISYGYHGRSELMHTEYEMDFLPDVGDLIHPLKNDEGSGMTFEISRRFWMEDGSVHLEVGKYIVDPEDGGVRFPRGWHSWYPDQEDDDLVELLLNNGWRKYEAKTDE